MALLEERDNAVTDLEAGDSRASGDDGARGIGAGDQGGVLLTSGVGTLEGKTIN